VFVSGSAQLLLTDVLDLFGMFSPEISDVSVKFLLGSLDLFELSSYLLDFSVVLSLVFFYGVFVFFFFPFKFSVDISLLSFPRSF
jgi:Na+/glutamate symporter